MFLLRLKGDKMVRNDLEDFFVALKGFKGATAVLGSATKPESLTKEEHDKLLTEAFYSLEQSLSYLGRAVSDLKHEIDVLKLKK